MFDAKSLFDVISRGAGQSQQQQGAGGLGDILVQLGRALGQPGGQGAPPQSGPGGMGGLGDILRNMVPSEGSGQGRAMAPGQAPQPGGGAGQPASRGPAMAPGGGGLGDILGRIQEQMGRSSQVGPGGAPGGGLLDALGQILGQATQGVKEGAQRIDRATGASGQVRDALGRATGQSPEDLLRQLKELIENNRLAAGAAAGGLGGVLLGTRTGRSVLGSAAKLGGLALIAGLAYKAVQNYQQGRPLIGGDGGAQQTNLIEAPRGSGFETEAISNAAATAYIRGMIAAAAADGRIDASEQQSIIGGLKQMGLDAEAEEFLAAEINQPASVDDLVACVSSQEEAVQLFTAARVAIDLDTQEEHDFLVSLARGLGLDGQLVAHIDAAARGTA